MRGISAFAAATCVLSLGGCALIYDYGGYTGAGNGDSGGQGGGGAGQGGAGGQGAGEPCGMIGVTEPCYTGSTGENVGVCKGGTRTCSEGGTWGSCEGEVVPSVEICDNGVNDDCTGNACTTAAVWSRRFGDAFGQNLHALAVDKNDRTVLAGQFKGALVLDTGVELAPPGDNEDAYVAVLNPNGNGLWIANVVEGWMPRSARGVTADGVGSVIATGNYKSTMSSDDSNYDVFVRKWAPYVSGNMAPSTSWTTKFGGGVGDNKGIGVMTDKNDAVYVLGTLKGTQIPITCANNPNNPMMYDAVGAHMFVAKLAAVDGACEWFKVFDGGNHEPAAIGADAQGHLLVTGSYTGTIEGTSAETTKSQRLFVLSLDSVGKVDWIKTFGDPNGGWAEGNAFVASDTGIFVTGSMRGTVDFKDGKEHVAGAGAVFVLALDTGGNTSWAKHFGPSGMGGAVAPRGTGITLTEGVQGALYVTGSFVGGLDVEPDRAGDELNSAGFTGALFLAKIEATMGNVAWFGQFGMGEPPTDRAVRLAKASEFAILAGGWEKPLDFGVQPPPTEGGGLDIFAARLGF
ncbi:hypothetical protein [Polyangium aurulentum]|uniref:hypothetical protein n=1 Tax=Polyangium aurulentum TaxID=2567896 RepID=UPI0010AE70DD|nr:hypothetical protein [Polyangium aurulentum]UQA56340.1 hypothetical protein E8A73_034240 [Polyangium aurulentum]